jgi:putative oxidoreductase
MKDLSLLVFRILLVAIFPISAYYKYMQWPGITKAVANAGLPYPEYLGMAGTAVEFVLPFLVLLGLFTRWAALGLIVYVFAATYIGHPIWKVAPDAFFSNLMSFMKNAGMIGGLLVLMAFGPGRLAVQPSEIGDRHAEA